MGAKHGRNVSRLRDMGASSEVSFRVPELEVALNKEDFLHALREVQGVVLAE